MQPPIPADVRAAYGVGAARAEPILVGWINRTFLTERGGERCIVQRLHPAFGADVHRDIEAVTAHLSARGLRTPRLLRTGMGELWHEAEDGVWRCFTYIEGRTVTTLSGLGQARAAGHFVGRFHRAVADLEHRFHFFRPGAHDTRGHLAKVEACLASDSGDDDARRAAEAVLAAAGGIEIASELPVRIVHGDLKASNLRFHPDHDEVLALVDLDTLAAETLQVELGDALRSWCNDAHESAAGAGFSAETFGAALDGYAEGSRDLLTGEERAAIVPGAARIAVELAARFAVDVFEDRYFGFDAERYPDRRAHNLARVQAQLDLARSVRAQRADLDRRLTRAFGR